MTGRRPIVAANWKMNFLRADAEHWAEGLRAAGAQGRRAEMVVFPPSVLLETTARALRELPVAWGGQDVHPEAKGAFTGDVAASQLADLGSTWTLCGHSERRRDHGETDTLVGRKAAAAREAGLRPLVCVGETREERRGEATFSVLTRQLDGLLAAGDGTFDLAYEPVWAIGTGETATVAMAQEAHAFLRTLLAARLGARRASEVRILYGGSATPDNAASLFAAPDIDGFLVGGASLDPVKFLGIVGVCG
jgi:triosephosphate isomerase